MSGWTPNHYVLFANGTLMAALICFIKNNSYGEYIFDWQWAQAYYAHGYNYYPKITSAIPFTPATGTKLLTSKESSPEQITALLDAFEEDHKKAAVSSVHHLFVPQEETPLWQKYGYILRLSYQFHWINKSFKTFEDFLSTLTGKRRRQIKKERESISQQGIVIRLLTAAQLDANWAETFYRFYLTTIDKKQGIPYLTLDFFRTIFNNFNNHTLLVVAVHNHDIVGASLAFFKGCKLYGRYWGGDSRYKNLHFELCYYQLIEFAISRNILQFEAGAQGEHKIYRGFSPTLTYSLHRFNDPQFTNAIAKYIEEEKLITTNNCHILSEKLPFKI